MPFLNRKSIHRSDEELKLINTKNNRCLEEDLNDLAQLAFDVYVKKIQAISYNVGPENPNNKEGESDV